MGTQLAASTNCVFCEPKLTRGPISCFPLLFFCFPQIHQSALLVPYFSWQRSHAVHHANTNHMEDGESHVPEKISDTGFGQLKQRMLFQNVLGHKLGTIAFGAMTTFNHLVVSQV